jgi:nuclear protein localization family protein 4
VFEAYQVSDLCTDMYTKGVIKQPRNPNKSYSRTSEEVLVERKPTQKVDNDFFINTVPIKTHAAPIFSAPKREAEFNVENRPTASQNALEVKHILTCHKSLPVCEQLRDFHMLLYLSKLLTGLTDMPEICKAVVEGTDVSEEHVAAIRSLADVK